MAGRPNPQVAYAEGRFLGRDSRGRNPSLQVMARALAKVSVGLASGDLWASNERAYDALRTEADGRVIDLRDLVGRA